jgi:putative lipoprotein
MHAVIKRFAVSAARLTLPLILLGVLVACDNDPNTMTEIDHRRENAVSQIEGVVIYRERIALPATAKVEVQLLDISSPDAPPTVLSSAQADPQNGPPFNFAIDINVSNLDRRKLKRGRYALRATIHSDDQLMFANNGFIDATGVQPIQILVTRVDAALAETPIQLEGTHWGLQTLGDSAADFGVGGKQVDIRFLAAEKRAAGFSGCNRFSGQYETSSTTESDGSITIGPIAGTRMACPKGRGDIERPYLAMLARVTAYRLREGTLTLLDGDEILSSFKPI